MLKRYFGADGIGERIQRKMQANSFSQKMR